MDNLKEQIKELISQDIALFDCQGDCPDEVAIYEKEHYGETIRTDDYCNECFTNRILKIFEQAGYIQLQADEKGLLTKQELIATYYGIEVTKDLDEADYMIERLRRIAIRQKALDDKEKEDKDEKYNKLADDNFGKVTGDLFRELANPIFRYEFLKETQQINGEILSSKLAIAKKEKAEAVKKVFDELEKNKFIPSHNQPHAYRITEEDIGEASINMPQRVFDGYCSRCRYEAFKNQTLEELK